MFLFAGCRKKPIQKSNETTCFKLAMEMELGILLCLEWQTFLTTT